MLAKKRATAATSIALKWKELLLITMILLLSGMVLCRAADDSLSDKKITAAIEEALLLDMAVKSNWIDVDTNEGITTLSGTVDNILAKERAERLARTVRGVRSVVNRIQVTTAPKADNQLERDINDALLWDSATDSYEIEVDADDGIVFLRGTVGSWQEKQLAAKVAKGVSGVESIVNNIDIDYQETRADHEIKAEIKKKLKWDAYVDDSLINIEVNNGNVVLSGTVASSAEKQRAIDDSWITGVTDVKADDLDVESWARDERFRKDKYRYKKDSSVRQAVNDALLYDPRVNMFDIDVSCDAGVVTLSGKVDNLKAKRAAEMDTENTVGVWKVKNNIKVRPDAEDMPSDSTVESRIERALINDPYVERYEIDVTVLNNVAYLNGEVDTYFEKGQADDVASTIYGVTMVQNNLEVEQEYTAPSYAPYSFPSWSVYNYPWYSYPYPAGYESVDTDWEIKDDIESELWWSPFVDEEEVNVYVEDGVARLTGEVDTWNEYLAAAENAREGGAVSVKNRLDVEYGPEE